MIRGLVRRWAAWVCDDQLRELGTARAERNIAQADARRADARLAEYRRLLLIDHGLLLSERTNYETVHDGATAHRFPTSVEAIVVDATHLNQHEREDLAREHLERPT